MAQCTRLTAALAAAAIVGGCSFVEEGLWPTLIGDEPARPAPPAPVQIAEPAAEPAEPGTAEPRRQRARPMIQEAAPATVVGAPQAVPLETAAAMAAPSTGTFVGAKVLTLRNELENLKRTLSSQNAEFQQILNNATQNSQRYHAVIAAVSARLQLGTTPGNPVLVSQWEGAQSELDRVVQNSSQLSELANRVASNSALANYLVESTRAAYGIQGAVDEDHRQLSILEDDVNRTVVSIERLLDEVNEDTTRQNSYVTGERRSLTALALAISNGEAFGPNLGNIAFSRSARMAEAAVAGSAVSAGAAAFGPPLVVIRFDRPDVDYQQALYNAVSSALDRRPSAGFDLVAVTPNRGSPSEVASGSGAAKRNAEKVLQSLLAMGLPADRVSLSSGTHDAALTNEVHVYVR
ncbi:MAG: hypothetical protein QF926_07795 [Alphaproteobacteria bacterium]|nr:hypothetical protein [Alphaproteobacteria bacterium]MDP6516509.1 hypothetical protein [Alphaproteobacteria bacterium]